MRQVYDTEYDLGFRVGDASGRKRARARRGTLSLYIYIYIYIYRAPALVAAFPYPVRPPRRDLRGLECSIV